MDKVDEQAIIDMYRQTENDCHPSLDIALDAISLSTQPFPEVAERLATLFEADQSARSGTLSDADWVILNQADTQRRVEVFGYIQAGQLCSGDDCYHAAMIFQHGDCLAHYLLAHQLALLGMKAGHEGCKWLCAASLDRYLMSKGEHQKFGTQYVQFEGRFVLFPVDPLTSDEERKAYHVPLLEEAIARAEEFNREG